MKYCLTKMNYQLNVLYSRSIDTTIYRDMIQSPNSYHVRSFKKQWGCRPVIAIIIVNSCVVNLPFHEKIRFKSEIAWITLQVTINI